MHDRIAVIKTGWCEHYDGDPVTGAHANVARHKEGHERYNFRAGPRGRYYGYTPPIGEKEVPPAPKQRGDWLVFVVAKKPGSPGIHLVGWYENARFEKKYLPRPEYLGKRPILEHDVHGNPFSYVLTATGATLIPSPARRFRFRGDHMKRSPVYYLRGNGENDAWREKLARRLLRAKQDFGASENDARAAAVAEPGSGICGDAALRKQVEDAAIGCVKMHYGDAYHFVDRQKAKCGFDLLFTHKKTGIEHHVEVKGTRQPAPHFFISYNELDHAEKYPQWRLAMVTNALDEPVLELMDYAAMKRKFRLKTVAWHATPRKA